MGTGVGQGAGQPCGRAAGGGRAGRVCRGRWHGGRGWREACFGSPANAPCGSPGPEHSWSTSWLPSPGRGRAGNPDAGGTPQGPRRWDLVLASDPMSKIRQLLLPVRRGLDPSGTQSQTQPFPQACMFVHCCRKGLALFPACPLGAVCSGAGRSWAPCPACTGPRAKRLASVPPRAAMLLTSPS